MRIKHSLILVLAALLLIAGLTACGGQIPESLIESDNDAGSTEAAPPAGENEAPTAVPQATAVPTEQEEDSPAEVSRYQSHRLSRRYERPGTH